MSKAISNPSAALPWRCTLAGLVLLACQAQAESPYLPGWTKNFRVGALAGFNIKGDFKMSGEFNISGNGSGQPGVYDDGYVLTDDTGNAQGYTSYWGYENADQYDPVNHTLLMHGSSTFTAAGSASASEDMAIGFDIAYGGGLKRWRRTRLGWEFGFGLLPIELKDGASLIVNVDRQTLFFDTSGIVMPGPGYQGGPSGLGPAIRDEGTPAGDGMEAATLHGSRALDVMLYSFRLGPTFFWDVSRRVGLSAGLGPTVGIASGTYEFNETLLFADGSSAANQGKFSSTEMVYGGYVNVTATYHVEERGDIYLGIQYMPMSGSTFSNGGRSASLDLQGQICVSLGVNWPF